jgi:hypothetical protein
MAVDGREKSVWSTPALSFDGELRDLVQMPGGGKNSPAPADGGDTGKPSGQAGKDPGGI